MIKIDFTTKTKITHKYVVEGCGNKCTYDSEGYYHSHNDLPALICVGGLKMWYKHGLLHRDNGLPAIVFSDVNGYNQYWLNGVFRRTELL